MTTSIDINQVLAQMRAISAGASNQPSTDGNEAGGAGFSTILKESVNQVNEAQQEAGRLKKAFETGVENVELPEVMIAVQKASISFQAMTQVRNKLMSAYQEIMNMQV